MSFPRGTGGRSVIVVFPCNTNLRFGVKDMINKLNVAGKN